MLEPSTFESVRQLHDFVNSSIPIAKRKAEIEKRIKKTLSLTPKEKENPQNLKVSLLPQGTKTPSKKGRLFYDLGEDGEDHLSLGRETKENLYIYIFKK